MIILDMLNILRTHGINPSSIPSNISSIPNHELVNDIRKLRAKLDPNSPEYKKGQALYKKVIKPVNIAFIRTIYLQQYYTSVHNNPLADLDYLFGQYDNNTIENPVLYRLLTEHRLQRNLFKYIILTEFCKNANNASAEEIEKLGVNELIKELLSLRDNSSSPEQQAEICMLIDEIQKKLVSFGMIGGGITEEQKLSATIVLAYCALFTTNEKIKNIAKSLIQKYSANPDQVIQRLSKANNEYEATIVADTTIDFEEGSQSIQKLNLSEYNVDSKRQILSSGNYDDLIMEYLIPARGMYNIDHLLVDEPNYLEESGSIAKVELVNTTYKDFWENFGYEQLNLIRDMSGLQTFVKDANDHSAAKKNNPVISRYLKNLEEMERYFRTINNNISSSKITYVDINLFGILFKNGASEIMLGDLWSRLSKEFTRIINYFASGKVGDNIGNALGQILKDLKEKQKNVDFSPSDIRLSDTRFNLPIDPKDLEDGLFKKVIEKYNRKLNELMDNMEKQINYLKNLDASSLNSDIPTFSTNFYTNFPYLPTDLVKKISVITDLNKERNAISDKLRKGVKPDAIFINKSSAAASAAPINLEEVVGKTDINKIRSVLFSYNPDSSGNTVDSTEQKVLWNKQELSYSKFTIFKNALLALIDSRTKFNSEEIKDDKNIKIGLAQFGRFIALGDKGYFELDAIRDAGVNKVKKNPGTTDVTPFSDNEKEILEFIFLTKYYAEISSGAKGKLSLSLRELPGCIEVETKELNSTIGSTFYHYDSDGNKIFIGRILKDPTGSDKDIWGYYSIKNKDTNEYMINVDGGQKTIKTENLGKTSTGGGFYKKYLKYKSKYLQIK
jgi:hypothetical protein